MPDNGYIGEVSLFAFGFEPSNWVRCDGGELPVAKYVSLFSVIGVTHGGNSTNFNVPDLRGAVPVGAAREVSSYGAYRPEARVNRSAAEAGSGATVPGSLELGWYICVQGVYPGPPPT